MLVKKTFNSRHAQAGVSLIELMISIALGLLLLGAATAMTVSSMVMNADTLKSAKLNQDLDSVLQVMVNDIRRAGYSDNIDPALPGVDYADNEDLNIVSAGCVLYAYNANGDGSPDPDERFGFKLEGNEIHMRTTCPDSAGTSCRTSCLDSVGTWVPLTDNTVINITRLTFDSIKSKCFNFSGSGNPNAYWVSPEGTTASPTTEFPCTAVKDVVNYVSDVNGDFPVVGVVGTVSDPLSGDTLIESRQVNVQIIGSLLENDDSMGKNQSVAINVRNNRITVTP